jgi:hypothetical protein
MVSPGIGAAEKIAGIKAEGIHWEPVDWSASQSKFTVKMI